MSGSMMLRRRHPGFEHSSRLLDNFWIRASARDGRYMAYAPAPAAPEPDARGEDGEVVAPASAATASAATVRMR